MIWHIFKKDARLLWWLAAGVAAFRFGEVAVIQSMGLFPVNPRLRNLALYLVLGGILGVGFAICAVVHQDAIPGVRQDWLARPIRRRDLLLAKFLFIVLLIQFPIFLGDLIQGMAAGFPVGASLAAAVSRSIMLLLIVDIPFFALASLTRNLMEAVTAGVLVFFLYAIFALVLSGGSFRSTWGTGEEWIPATALALTMCVSAAILLRLQYFRRRTRLARCLGGLFAVISLCSIVLPWQPAFAVQKSMSPAPGSAAAIGVSFAPGAGKIKRDASFPVILRPWASDIEGAAFIYLPMRVTGLPEDSGLQSDRIEIRLSEPDGAPVSFLPAYQIRLGARRTRGSAADQDIYQTISLPGGQYSRMKDRPVRLEIDYSLTLFTLASSTALSAVNGNEHIAGVGWCGTKINPAETAVQVSCEQAGRGPDCMTLVLEHIPTGQRNPERFGCDADYAPYRDWILPDGLTRFGGNLPFRDANGLAKYPVNGSKLGESRVVMQIYRATDHFTRKLVIPDVRLSDWEAPSTEE